MDPFEVLVELDGRAGVDLPDGLRRIYGGELRLPEAGVYANFVTTLDGVAAIRSEPTSPRLLSDASEPDRFLMGMLRACADVVLVGSGTVRDSPGARFTPEQVHPPAAALYDELRERLGRRRGPAVAVLSASGAVATRSAAVAAGALVLTTDAGAAALAGRLPPAQIVSLGPGPAVDVRSAVSHLRARGCSSILSEGGPTVLGSLLAAGLVEELFLTISPLVAGRDAEEARPGLVAGHVFLPASRVGWRLLSARRHGSHLFLRYAPEGSARA